MEQAISEHHNGVVCGVAVLQDGRAAGVGYAIAGPEGRADNVVLATVEDRRTDVAYVLTGLTAQLGERSDSGEGASFADPVLEASRAVELELDVAVEVAVVVGQVLNDLAQRLAADFGLLEVTYKVFELDLNLVRRGVFEGCGLADACHGFSSLTRRPRR